MLLLFFALLAVYIVFLEVRIQADFQHEEGTQARVILRLAGIHKTWRLMLTRTSQGRQVMLAKNDGAHPLSGKGFRKGQGRFLLALFRRADQARHFLLRHIHLDRLDALAFLRTEDAARSALLSGTLQSITACIPAIRRHSVRIRVLPEFFRAYSTVKARCIIHLRVGTIILTAMMLLIAILREQRLAESEAG